MQAGASFVLPRAAGGAGTKRTLYFFRGGETSTLTVGGGQPLRGHSAVGLDASQDVELICGDGGDCECLLLQGKPSASQSNPRSRAAAAAAALSLSGGCADHGAAMRPAGGTTAHLEAGGGALLEGGLEVLHVLHQP
jgi:hypothetical protein